MFLFDMYTPTHMHTLRWRQIQAQFCLAQLNYVTQYYSCKLPTKMWESNGKLLRWEEIEHKFGGSFAPIDKVIDFLSRFACAVSVLSFSLQMVIHINLFLIITHNCCLPWSHQLLNESRRALKCNHTKKKKKKKN